LAQYPYRPLLNRKQVEQLVKSHQRLARLAVHCGHRYFRDVTIVGQVKNPTYAPLTQLPLDDSQRHRQDEAAQGIWVSQGVDPRKDPEKNVLC
jgi:hypothetical protein